MATAVILDYGNGRVTGWRKDALAAVREVLEPVRQLGVTEFTFDASAGTDNFDFLLEGVPTLVANQEPANYMLNFHAASDTFDKVDIPALKKQVAIAALTAYGIADREERIAPRQTRAEVEQLHEATGLEEDMKTEGMWKTSESGSEDGDPRSRFVGALVVDR